MSKGRELLRDNRLEDGKAVNMAPPPAVRDRPVRINRGKDGELKVTRRKA
ncbi:MAG: hypothetical protein ACTHLP_06920 [Rhizobiaceae bacterium]